MATEVDLRAVSSFTGIAESHLSSLIASPTVDLVKSLLKSIELKARDYEQVKTQKVRLEVELETSVRTSESKVKALKKSVEKGLAESSKLRVDLQNSENTRSQLESEIEQVKAATTHDASETTALRSRISSLESSNRDTLALLEAKTTAYNSLSQEVATQHEKSIELRKQLSGLEQTIQSANSAAASARFREQSLEQERDLLKKNVEWLENELKTKAAEHTKFRKEKNARMAELTQSTEQYISEAEALRRSEASLRSRLDEQIQKVEDLMQEMQQLREQNLAEAENLRADLDSANRLATLQEEKARSNKDRADQLQQAHEEARAAAAEEIGQLRAEMETEHSDRETAEHRVAELEATVHRLQSETGLLHSQPGTPSHGMNGPEMSTPLRPSTPSGIFSPASAPRMLGNLSMTQMFSQYQLLEKSLIQERKTTERLQSELDDMLQGLEVNKPEIDELRTEYQQLQSEIIEMSELVQTANQERNHALKQVRTLQGQAESYSKEVALLTQQVRDGNAQIKLLLFEQELQKRGQQLSLADYDALWKDAIGDITYETPTSQVISVDLTAFRNIAELEDQNSKMRNMLRQLGEQMEGEEAQAKERQYHIQAQELEVANSELALLKEQIKSTLATQKTFQKERDMFKDMLTRKGRILQGDNDFARSLPLPTGSPQGFDGSIQGSAAGGDHDYGKLLRDLQMHFDSYKQESVTDQTALKSQVSELSKRNSQLQAEASRAISQLAAANQRCEMLQANFNALKTENTEIQKRSQTFMENATRQELKGQQAAEELIENKGLLDGMRREVANLKAEKDLFKSVERRLVEDAEALRNERGRLDQLNASLQTMLNEREQSDSETRRRLQTQIEALDSELQMTKRKLDDEVNDGKKASLRREYEHEHAQKRIDDLVSTLGSLREELSVVKTTRDHLQARVDEMTIDLRSAEERIAVLSQPLTQTNDEDTSNEFILSQEQELAVEVSELKRDLEQKTSELARVTEQVEVYKSISQQAEDRLQQLTETNDQYREETERALSEKATKIKDLEQRLEDITSELSTTNTELSTLRDEQSESTRKLDEQKNTLEAEITRAKDEAQRNLEQAQYNLEASKAQAQIAAEAQQKYEDEAIKNGDAWKKSRAAEIQVNQLKLDLTQSETKAAAAIHDLAQKEESWSEMKRRYEREIGDLKQRREEVVQQNTLLHNQLETLTTQISQLQKDRAAAVDSHANVQSPAPGADNLQEVIKYLRREKEIVDVQYHLSTQEQKRLRQQLDFTQSQLDDTRLKLDQQRRTEVDTERNAASYTKLMETLNEINLYRESSVTLRAESKRATDALAQKIRLIEELTAQIEPLQTRVAELENLSEMRDGEMKLLQEDRDHWQQRTQNILSKYDRVDPAELESLKEMVTTLETERDAVIASRDDLQAQVDNIPEQIKASNAELRTRLGEQFKTKVKELNGKIKDKQNEFDTAIAEKDALQSELDSTKEELETSRTQPPTGAALVNGVGGSEPDSVTPASGDASGVQASVAELQARIKELESSLAQKEQEIASLKSQHDKVLQEQKQHLDAEHQLALEELRARSVPISSELQKPSPPESTAQATTTETGATSQIEELPYISEAQARLLVQKHEVIRRILSTNIKKGIEKKEEALRREFELAQAAIRDTTSPDQVAELEKQVATHQEILKQKEEEFMVQKQALISHQEEKLEEEKLVFTKEAEKKVIDQIALAEKRTAVQLSMAKNKAGAAQAKIDIVKKAAEETPQKPVVEVWEVAKDAKAAPTKPAATASQIGPVSSPTGQKAAPSQNGTVKPVPAAVSSTSQTSAPAPAQAPTPAANGVNKASLPTPAPVAAVSKPAQSSIPPRGGAATRGRGGISSGSQSQPAASSESQQLQASTRGTGIPRGNFGFGRGRGGRAGAPNVQTSGQAASRGGHSVGGSPRGNLNPSAQQFQPGLKRAREDGEAGGGNDQKKHRGSGAGLA